MLHSPHHCLLFCFTKQKHRQNVTHSPACSQSQFAILWHCAKGVFQPLYLDSSELGTRGELGQLGLRIYRAPNTALLALKTNVTSPNIRIALWQRWKTTDSRTCKQRIMYENDLRGGSKWKKKRLIQVRTQTHACKKERRLCCKHLRSLQPPRL